MPCIGRYCSWHTVLAVCLGGVAVLGDKMVSVSKNDIYRAVCDNATHGLIGFISWCIIVLHSKRTDIVQFLDMCICGLCSSFIDVDHFLGAKSFKIKDALNLQTRPFLHCTSIPMMVCAVSITSAHLFGYTLVYRYSCLLLVAILSHHIRDGTRRGLWLWPFGSTQPLPYLLYISSTIALPHVLSVTMKDTYSVQLQDPLTVSLI